MRSPRRRQANLRSGSEVRSGEGIQVLCVDDDPDILSALKLTLHRRFRVTTASSGAGGLAALRKSGPFAVILSDMRMPAMDGVGFLARVRDAAPATVRMLLTGDADISVAIDAVNEGQIFRFLRKPCPPKQLVAAFEAAAEQYRLLSAERVLLEQTLRGCVKTLTHLLSMSNPAAFGRSSRMKDMIGELAERLGAPDAWEIEVAAMLSQIGCVTLPPEMAQKLYYGEALNEAEQALASRLPEVSAELLRDIPRLEGVREILALQDQCFDGRGTRLQDLVGEQIPLGARLLKIASDYDQLETQGVPEDRRIPTLRAREGWYDSLALDTLEDLLTPQTARSEIKDLRLRALRTGMILASDVVTKQGALLIARGNEITAELLTHLGNFSPASIQQPIRVAIPR